MMKKTIILGALAAALIGAGGAGLYLTSAQQNAVSTESSWQEMGGGYSMMGAQNFDDRQRMMNGTFEQMKPYMEPMHPDLNSQELEDMYQSCSGQAGEYGNL